MIIDPSQSSSDEYEQLCAIIDDNGHFLTPELATFLKRKCQIELERSEVERAGRSLLHAQAISFHHQTTFQQFRRIQKRQESTQRPSIRRSHEDLFEPDTPDSPSDTPLDTLQRQIMTQQASILAENHVEKVIRSLPDAWRVVQINTQLFLQSRFKKESSEEAIRSTNLPLLITQIDCGQNELVKVAEVPSVKRSDRPTILSEFQEILHTHRQIYTKNQKFDRVAYNQTRDELDDRLLTLLDTIENRWLGFAKLTLLGRPKDPERVRLTDQAFKKCVTKLKLDHVQKSWLWNALDGASWLEEGHLVQVVELLTSDKTVAKALFKAVQEFGVNNPSAGVDRHPVVLILDKDIQLLPWEALPMMKNQQCSRVPSLFFLASLYASHHQNKASVAKVGVNNEKIFYVLNPNNDLQKTQDRLESPFRALSLGEGFVGEWPSFPKIQGALSEMDAFMYCGHGSRLKTITSQEIEKLNIRALPLLFGCNSGRLERLGRTFDPTGTASSYLIASAPCLLGFLWSVTDLDIDTWTVEFLEHWLEKRKGQKDFVKAVAEKRHCFKRLVNSAATVVYGLPSFFETR
ncbi:hypothetical protein TCAL_04651 [Tigriopus californicus]|uniref:separase n=2 Tax=Tigriopus californicus TaxID=6832 RepID=A0A553NCV0_TIGCA|nr:hypothetical protein TCAL_04651 [Tigriopus californicus]